MSFHKSTSFLYIGQDCYSYHDQNLKTISGSKNLAIFNKKIKKILLQIQFLLMGSEMDIFQAKIKKT